MTNSYANFLHLHFYCDSQAKKKHGKTWPVAVTARLICGKYRSKSLEKTPIRAYTHSWDFILKIIIELYWNGQSASNEFEANKWAKKQQTRQKNANNVHGFKLIEPLKLHGFFVGVLYSRGCSLLLRSIKLSVSHGIQVYTTKWLCGGLLFLLPLRFFCLCARGTNTPIFTMDNSQRIECVCVCVTETTKTESTCLVDRTNTGDRVNENWKKNTHIQALVHELMDVLLSHRQCVVGKPNNHPIFFFNSHTHTHVCEPYGVSRAPFVLTI